MLTVFKPSENHKLHDEQQLDLEEKSSPEETFISIQQLLFGVIRRWHLTNRTSQLFFLELCFSFQDPDLAFIANSRLAEQYKSKVTIHSEIVDQFYCKFMICYHLACQ